MRHCSCREVLFSLALSLSVMLIQGFGSKAIAQPDTTSVRMRGLITLDLSPSEPDTSHTIFEGVARLIWSESAPYQITAEMDTCRLQDWQGFWMNEDPLLPSVGDFHLPDESWVESFFDVYLEIHVPELPGETLKMLTPLHLVGMARSWPPYFDSLRTPEEMPPVPLYIEGIESGHILSCDLEMMPYYEPEARVSVPTAYGSEVALLDDEGRIAVNVALTGDYEPTEATFGYRLYGDPGPFTVFSVDVDGSARHYPPGEPATSGDGWTGYFDPGSDPFNEGQVVEFEASLLVPSLGTFKDTVRVWVEETPPIPEIISIAPDSIASFDIDSFFDVTFKVDDEWLTPGSSQLLLFPLELYESELPGISQYDLGTPFDSVSCVPVASAMIIKYFAMNGCPGLDFPWGDTTRTMESVADIARELQKLMRLARKRGADEKVFPIACGGFLTKRGKWVWKVFFEQVRTERNVADMYREFASDSEQVMLCISDTDSTTGVEVRVVASLDYVYAPAGGGIVIGFTDPSDGQHKEYPLGPPAPPPTIVGYDAPGCSGGDAKLVAWMSISRVLVPDPGAGRSGKPAKAPLRAPWILVDSGIARGNGLVDTLHFDTSPFPSGWYLMEVATLDNQGFECRDIRLAKIGSTTGVDDPGAPAARTVLRGSYPNPFNPSTTIEYSLASKTTVSLIIYDAAGRRVKTLISGVMTEAGVHKVNWDGTNDNGTRLASGVYFASLAVEGRLSAKKLVLLR
jgi:hypothetical protein